MYFVSNEVHMFNFNPVPLPAFLESQNDPNYIACQTPYSDGDITQMPDFPDDCLQFISDILMEEDLDDNPGASYSLQDYSDLQATEKSFYEALGEAYPPSSDPGQSSVGQSTESSNVVESDWTQLEPTCQSSGSSNCFDHLRDGVADSPVSTLLVKEEPVSGSRGRKNYQRDNGGYMGLGERSSKQIAANYEEYGEMEKFDDVLICKEGNDDISPCTSKTSADDNPQQKQQGKSRGLKSRKSKSKKSNEGEVVDLRSLLTQCAEAVASFELTSANELLKRIRHNASPFGDSVQRVAHYFANGLEARLSGRGSELYKEFAGKQISSYETLRAYQSYAKAVPLQRTTNFVANQTIAKLAEKATKLHIIDFGIFLGFQWPCLIQNLSRRPQGPPMLRITGVDYPQSGFRPAQKVEETGHRLAGYCERFGVPFQFQAIAQKWHTLKPEQFKIEEDELVVVTCLYQSTNLADETIDDNSPRDYFLSLIRSFNPSLFIHGVINGTFNAPFFITRFREALYHYSCLFDIFDATIERENDQRLLIENDLYGKEALNIIACEGRERIERPQTYKQWQLRKLRAGFKQLPLHQDIVNRARAMVKANYNKDFMVEQDRHWIVQGWKGRILSAISCWKPA